MDLKWNPADYESVVKAIENIGPHLVQALHVLSELPCPSPDKDKNGKYVVKLVNGKPAIIKIQ